MENKQAKSVKIQFPNIIVTLKKGGLIVFSKNDYPYLQNLSKEQLEKFKITGAGFCITWDEFDIDMGVEYLIARHGVLDNKIKKAS